MRIEAVHIRNRQNRLIPALTPLVLIAALVIGDIGVAEAEESDSQSRYESHFRRGVSLFRGREYEAALTEFVEAHRLRGHYAILLNIAYCYQEMGRAAEAIDHFERYLEGGGRSIPRARRREVEGELRELRARVVDVTIRVNIDGAAVFVDGREVGTAPLDAPISLRTGAVHRVEARLSGYRTATEELSLAQGVAPPPLELELIRASLSERLQIRTTPPGAVVFINDEQVGTTPYSSDLETGAYAVELRLDGYETQSREVAIVAGEPRILQVELQPLAAPGLLSLELNVEGAEVYVDNELAGTTPLDSPLSLPVGGHRLRVQREGYQPWNDDIVMESNQQITADVTLAHEEGGVAPGYFWSTLGITAATGIGAIVTGILTLNQQSEVDDFLAAVRAGEERGTNVELDRRRRDLQNEGSALALTTDVLWISSAAFAAATLVLGFFTRFGPASSDAEIEVVASTVPGGAMLLASGRLSR